MNIDLHDAIRDNNDSLDQIETNYQLGRKYSVYMTKNDKSSTFQAFFLLLKGYSSVGILAIPYMFVQSGYILTSSIIILSGCFTVYSINLLFEIADHINILEDEDEEDPPIQHYSDIAEAIYGLPGVYIIKIFTVTFQLGTCLTYLQFFDKYFTEALSNFFHMDKTSHILIYGIQFIGLAGMSTINNIRDLTLFCINGIILSSFCCIFYLILDIQYIFDVHWKIQEKQNLEDMYDFKNFVNLINVVVFQFTIVGIVFNIKNNMQKSDDFVKILKQSTFIIVFIFIIFGFINQQALGMYVQKMLLFNYPKDSRYYYITSIFLEFGYALAQFFTFPLKLFPVVVILENTKTFKKYFKSYSDQNNDFNKDNLNNITSLKVKKQQYICYKSLIVLMKFFKKYLVRFFIVLCLVIFSKIHSQFIGNIAIFGSIGGIFNQFVFPARMYNKYFFNYSQSNQNNFDNNNGISPKNSLQYESSFEKKKSKYYNSFGFKFKIFFNQVTQILGVLVGLMGIYQNILNKQS